MSILLPTLTDCLQYGAPALGALGLFARRGGRSNRRGVGKSRQVASEGDPPVETTPLTIVSTVNILQWCRADLGHAAADGAAVGAAWADQSPAGADYAQATGTAQPIYTAADVTLNSKASLTFDGSNDYMAATVTLGAGSFVWVIFKQITWTLAERLCGGNAAGSARMMLRQDASGVTPDLEITATANSNPNSGAPIGEWRRAEMHFTNSTSDYLKIGGTTVTGVNVGVGAVTIYEIGRCIGNNANVAIAEILICDGRPSNDEITALDAYVTSRYGAGLV